MSTGWPLDLSPDTLQVDFTIDDLMADLDADWSRETTEEEQ